VRNCQVGGGVYKAMQRNMRGRQTTASDWLWSKVADMQQQHAVSATAQRPQTGPWKTCEVKQHWREELLSSATEWDNLLQVVHRAVHRKNKDEPIPRMSYETWDEVYSTVKGQLKGRKPANILRACLWGLAATRGVLVDGQGEDDKVSGDWTNGEWWDRVLEDMGDTMQDTSQLRDLKKQVLGWHAAMGKAEDATMYLTNWCAGWPEKTRLVAERYGIQVIAVDKEQSRLGEHRLNTHLDLLTISPAWWKPQVASMLGLKAGQLAWDFGGVPCTTQARSDSSNKRMSEAGEVMYNNYRITSGKKKGKPQHPEGTKKGDEARNSDRLNVAMLWMCNSGRSLSWGIENPHGQLRKQGYMARYEQQRVDLDYCRFWDKQERSQGYEWQKPSQIWTSRLEGGKWNPQGEGGERLCKKECSCGFWKAREQGTRVDWKHRGSTEELTEMVQRLGGTREQHKCVYPRALFRDWLVWAVQLTL
jgi:hypothetical protein